MRNPIGVISPVRPGCRQYLASVLVVLFATVAIMFVGPVMAQAPSAPTAVTAAAGSSQVTVITGTPGYQDHFPVWNNILILNQISL